jgi:hypothetical protein
LGLNAPTQSIDSHCCVPFAATFIKRRNIGVLCNEHFHAWQCGKPFLHTHLINGFFLGPASERNSETHWNGFIPWNHAVPKQSSPIQLIWAQGALTAQLGLYWGNTSSRGRAGLEGDGWGHTATRPQAKKQLE